MDTAKFERGKGFKEGCPTPALLLAQREARMRVMSDSKGMGFFKLKRHPVS